MEEVLRAGAQVYVVRYPDALSQVTGDGLSRLAMETGGAEFTRGSYETVLERIQIDLRSQYVLSFHPEASGTSNHRLRVETVRPGLFVRSRTQYVVPE